VALVLGVALWTAACASPASPPGEQPVPLTNFDWANRTNLTNHDYWDFDPEFSPDGTRIAFHSNRDPSPGNRGQIYVMNADGSNPTALTHTNGTNYGAVWSPDGSRIAFASERDGNAEVYVMNADGSEQTNLTNNPDGYDSGPDWSPDGRYLAYFTGMRRPETDEHPPPGAPYRYWDAELYVMDLETGDRTRITQSDRDDIYPEWSHDGRRLTFTSSRDGNNEVYVINVDGSGTRRLTNNDVSDTAASFLPGDDFITFRNDAGDGEGDHSNIYVCELDTGTITRVTDQPGVVYFSASLSPDGQTALFAAFTKDETAFRGERADVYVVRR